MYYNQQQPEQFRDSNYFKKNEVGNTSSEDVTQLNPWNSYAYAKNIMYSYGYNDFIEQGNLHYFAKNILYCLFRFLMLPPLMALLLTGALRSKERLAKVHYSVKKK